MYNSIIFVIIIFNGYNVIYIIIYIYLDLFFLSVSKIYKLHVHNYLIKLLSNYLRLCFFSVYL